MPDARVVVLGVGNELMRDDAVGVEVVRRLAREPADERVEFLEAGTAVIEALDLVPPGAHVIVIDAASGGGPPGSVYRFGLDDVAVTRGVSLHETALSEAFAVARLGGAAFGNVVILGVEPAEVAVGTRLSPSLQEKLPAVLEAARREIARLVERIATKGHE